MEVERKPRPVPGFRFAGVSAGIKKAEGALDFGLIVADRPAAAAAVFTSNRVKAAPVIVAAERIRHGRLQAVVANSGCANCFTGKPGLKLARDSCAAVAREIGCPPELVAPCSTGVIGHLYNFAKFKLGAFAGASMLHADGLGDFARAIMTTDTQPKIASLALLLGGVEVTIAAAAKGAGMIAPKMATLLGFIMTDAALPAAALRSSLRRAMPSSFNAITIDGDMSTNDTVILIARDRQAWLDWLSEAKKRFGAVIFNYTVTSNHIHLLVYDGEGATKLVRVEVGGARSASDAQRVARQIANSPLVKTAFFGCDPNVGRIIGAAGASGVAFDPDRIELHIGSLKIASRGAIMVEALEKAAAVMREREFTVRLDMKTGKAAATILTSDLSLGYVKINAEYMT
jgi:glutamate N-acetyltransferase/amino-acid N-acetyltransferase